MVQKLIVIKLGGSILTNKNSSTPSPNLEVITSIAKQVSRLFQIGYKRLIIVHGAGSYGHPLARKYQLHQNHRSAERIMGAHLTHRQMLELNHLVVTICLQNQLPALGISPNHLAFQSAGKLIQFNSGLVKRVLANNLIPILFGDVVMDREWEFSVLSGDVITSWLAQKLSAEKVIFLSDVDGIYEQDPKLIPTAKHIPLINDQNLQVVLKGIKQHNPDDVSGEMRGKILSIQQGLPGKEVIITNGLEPDALIQSVVGVPIGTKLFFD